MADKTPLSSQYFTDMQKFVALELGLVMIPVSQCTEAAGFLHHLVRFTLLAQFCCLSNDDRSLQCVVSCCNMFWVIAIIIIIIIKNEFD